MKSFFYIIIAMFCCLITAIANDRPNFVIIFVDDQGYQDLGCFGSETIKTPRIDTLAKEGIKFTNFYAQPICGPSRTALMTGCYPFRVAEKGNQKNTHPVVHSSEITIAEKLKEVGYRTGCFGKWDLAGHSQKKFNPELMPNEQGFDVFYGTPSSNDGFVDLYQNKMLVEANADMSTLTRKYNDAAIEFIRENKDDPFFVYLPHSMPHTRLDASQKFKGKSQRGLYGDVIEEIDYEVGRLIDTLIDLDLHRKTYVLYTSDNGPWAIKNKGHRNGVGPEDHGGSALPLRGAKVSCFEGGVRVPTVLWGPGRVPEGKTCDALAATIDLFPTLIHLAGGAKPNDRVIDGENISSLFHGEFDKAKVERVFYYYLRGHLQAVRQGKWKLHLPREKEPIGAYPFSVNQHIHPDDRVGFDQPFLVDLHHDVAETHSVAAQHPEVVAKLMNLAEKMREDLGDYNRIGKNMRFVPETTKPRELTYYLSRKKSKKK